VYVFAVCRLSNSRLKKGRFPYPHWDCIWMIDDGETPLAE
jgi:hypothetical protein